MAEAGATASGLLRSTCQTRTSLFWVPLNDGPLGQGRRVSFEDWWAKPILVAPDGRQITRSGLVLTVANQDGGAHVDPELERIYAEMSRQNLLGGRAVVLGEERDLGDPCLYAVRQIAHELLTSLALVRDQEPPRSPVCHCGSGRPLRLCHEKRGTVCYGPTVLGGERPQ
jgi:hypothetical protein